VDSGGFSTGGVGPRVYVESLGQRNSFLQEMVRGDGKQPGSRKKTLGVGFESRGQLGKLRHAVNKYFHSSLRAKLKVIHARAICLREFFLAYLCIFLIESACLFPAVWVR
jgi:hypothetical protein